MINCVQFRVVLIAEDGEYTKAVFKSEEKAIVYIEENQDNYGEGQRLVYFKETEDDFA